MSAEQTSTISLLANTNISKIARGDKIIILRIWGSHFTRITGAGLPVESHFSAAQLQIDDGPSITLFESMEIPIPLGVGSINFINTSSVDNLVIEYTVTRKDTEVPNRYEMPPIGWGQVIPLSGNVTVSNGAWVLAGGSHEVFQLFTAQIAIVTCTHATNNTLISNGDTGGGYRTGNNGSIVVQSNFGSVSLPIRGNRSASDGVSTGSFVVNALTGLATEFTICAMRY